MLFATHPNTLVNYRKGFRPSGAKSDPSDAGLLVDLLVRHRENCAALIQIQSRRALCYQEERQQAVDHLGRDIHEHADDSERPYAAGYVVKLA